MKRKEISLFLVLALSTSMVINPFSGSIQVVMAEESNVEREASTENTNSNVNNEANIENADTNVKDEANIENADTNVKDEANIENADTNVKDEASTENADTNVNDEANTNYIYLSDIEYMNSSNTSWGTIKKDSNLSGAKISLKVNEDIVQFNKGIAAHANSTLIYDVSNYSNKYTNLSMYMGVDNSQNGKGNGVKFTISTSSNGKDWNVIKETGILLPSNNAEYVNLDISDVNYIKLYANDNGSNANDHSVYAEARLVKSDYDLSNEQLSSIKRVSEYDTLLKSNYTIDQEITGEYEKLLLERTFVKRYGYANIQQVAKESKGNKEALEYLFNNKNVLKFFVTGGEKDRGSYINSLNTWCKLYNKYKEDFSNETYLKMAVSISIEYSRTIKLWTGNAESSDPIERYKLYKDLILNGKMDQGGNVSLFVNLPIELMRWVINNAISDIEINWLTDLALERKALGKDYLSGYEYITYTSGFNYSKPIYHDPANYDKWNNKWKISQFPNYEDRNVHRLWMVFQDGAVCGGLSKTYTNLAQLFGKPSAVVGQPGHAASLTYDYYNSGEWTIQNNISGWSGSEKGERLPLGWGSNNWDSYYNVSYVLLAQRAFDDYDNLVKAMYYNYLADVYSDDTNSKIAIYEKALSIQNFNLDSIVGLINCYKNDSSKTSSDYLELAKRVINAYTYYPTQMVDVLNLFSSKITNSNDLIQFDLLKTNALKKAVVATSNNVKQPSACIELAKNLLGQNSVELASFSFDGKNAGNIVINSKYDNSEIRVRYSLDGGNSWSQTSEHTISLSKDELNSINDTDDIIVGLVGTNDTYTIDIKPGERISNSKLYKNDLENLLIGKTKSLEFSTDNGATWCDYVDGLDGTRFPGDQVIKVRYKANGVYMMGPEDKYTFHNDTDSETRKYIQLKNITLDSFSSQNNNGSEAASNMIDGNANTNWHTTYNTVDKDKYYTVKLDKVRHITSIEYLPGGQNGRLKDADIYTSLDGIDWIKSGSATNLSNNDKLKTLNLDKPTAAKYVKIVGVNTYGNHSSEYNMYFSGKMFNFYEDTTKNTENDNNNKGITAELNQSKGGMMLSTAGLGLRFFTSVNNVDPKEPATYYVTTANNSTEKPSFEVKCTILNKDYSQLKTSIEFSELSKLDTNVDTKLYLKRVVKNQEPTYTELVYGNVDLTNPFNISDSKISISVTKDDNNVVKLNKTILNENLFNQGLSNIYWNQTGMVIEGTPTLNNDSSAFENAKVAVLLKDSLGNYIQQSGKNVEVRGMYNDGKYIITIPYNMLDNTKTFELRLIGSNIQSYDVLTKGNLNELKSVINNKKEYIISTDSNEVINLDVSEVKKLSSQLSNIKITNDPNTGIQQFSIKGNLFGGDVNNIKSSIRYTLIAKKENNTIFEQLITRVKDSKGSYNNFKANISLKTLMDLNLDKNDELSLILKVDYLGKTSELDLNSMLESLSLSDSSSNETFELISKDGKSVLVKK